MTVKKPGFVTLCGNCEKPMHDTKPHCDAEDCGWLVCPHCNYLNSEKYKTAWKGYGK